MEELNEISSKLNSLINLKTQVQERKLPEELHKCAILTKYLEDIKKCILDTSEKIDDIYSTVQQYEDEQFKYEDLYEDLVSDITNEKEFMNTFGPYMVLWNLYAQ